jgi:hypothetical protein
MKRNDEHHKCQVAIVDFCRSYHGAEWIFAIPNGDIRPRTTRTNKDGKKVTYSPSAIRLKREGVLAGVWDLFLPVYTIKGETEYSGLWIEVKVGKDRLSAKQKAFGEYVRSQGYATFETDKSQTTQSAINAIQAYLRGEFVQGRKY